MQTRRAPGLRGLSLLLTATLAFAPTWAGALDLWSANMADLEAAMAKRELTSEKLVKAYLARIAAYDQQGPKLNSVVVLNPKAIQEARLLDKERRAGKLRGPLHGIPIVLKDNFDTVDLPTTAGSQLLAGSMAPDDAFVVKKLRAAGAIVLAKLNLHEFAGGGGSVGGAKDPAVLKAGAVPNGSSTIIGQTLNPHRLDYGPAGSSGGTGAAIAAGFAQFGLGTDTGGSIRGPSSVNGIVGLKPTHGLLSRDGIVPLALTFDTGGPMARSVTDIALAMNVMTGVDPADPATRKSEGHIEPDYTAFLKTGALRGARIGIARDFTGHSAEADRVLAEAVMSLQKLGATTVDFHYPDYMLEGRMDISALIMASEFKAQIADYLKTTAPSYPKTLDDLVRLANDPATGYRSASKAFALKYTQSIALELDDPIYLAARDEGLAMITRVVDGVIAKNRLDAIVYLTNTTGAAPIKLPDNPQPASPTASPTNIANQTGYPDLIVPAGMTRDGRPISISFFGPAFSEGRLLGYGYDFEKATHAIRVPKFTPVLPGDRL
jgi:amidase